LTPPLNLLLPGALEAEPRVTATRSPPNLLLPDAPKPNPELPPPDLFLPAAAALSLLVFVTVTIAIQPISRWRDTLPPRQRLKNYDWDDVQHGYKHCTKENRTFYIQENVVVVFLSHLDIASNIMWGKYSFQSAWYNMFGKH
jgi:hypothetical protein